MKASFWAFLLSLVLAATAKAQQPAIAPATNALATNGLGKVAEIRVKAEKGDAAAQTELGHMFEWGNGTPMDWDEAAKWYRKAAEQGNSDAQFNLVYMYAVGMAAAKDETEAVRWYRKEAEHGNGRAQLILGEHYYHGNGVSQDYAEAVKWFRKATEHNDTASQDTRTNQLLNQVDQLLDFCAWAQYHLGVCYETGHGVAQDYTEALQWYRKAAERGNANAQWMLGWSFAQGLGVPQDYAEAVRWYRKAAEQGNADAQWSLGSCCDDGQGVPQNYLEAVKWYRKAADQGQASAQNALGYCYSQGNGVPQDYAQAVKWYTKAGEQGDADAQGMLGVCFYLGNGTSQDYVEAVKWYRKAAEQGNANAQEHLGVCYYLAQGVAQDYAEAAKWFRKSAEQGNAAGQYSLGGSYDFGKGVPKDSVEAYKWYNLAAAQGDETAATNRLDLENRMTPEQIAEAQRLARDFKPSKTAQPAQSLSDAEPVAPTSPTSSGTGFFITDDGFLVTAAHVVNGANQIRLVTRTGLLIARLVKLDAANDLALLKAEGQFSALPIVSSRAVKLGSTIATIGFPNVGLQGFAPKFAKGEIASLTGPQDDPRYFQISAPVQPGNSGGALVDDRGNVVGVVSSKLDAATALAASGALPENVNYAIKSSFLLSFLESVPEVVAKIKEPTTKEHKFEDVVKSAEQAAVLVLVY